MSVYDYEEEIECEECGKLIGYAPYTRTAYLCIECWKTDRVNLFKNPQPLKRPREQQDSTEQQNEGQSIQW